MSASRQTRSRPFPASDRPPQSRWRIPDRLLGRAGITGAGRSVIEIQVWEQRVGFRRGAVHRLGGVLTWRPLAWGWLSGRYRKGQPVDMTVGRPTIDPARFDVTTRANRKLLDAVEGLHELADDLGCSLPALAMAFPPTHLAVTSVILGPRTPEQLQSLLDAATTSLDDATLDRIDEIVASGTDLYLPNGAWRPPALTDPTRRRRLATERSAA